MAGKNTLLSEMPIGRHKPLTLAIRALIAGGFVVGSGIGNGGELPVALDAAALASQGQATAAVNGNNMTITQTTDKATLEWQSFNIGAQNGVRFDQPSSSSVALNNIHQGDASQILGSLSANGQVYLVNQNGFVFGKDSQVNVNSLVATTLNISQDVFQRGITKAFDINNAAALEGNGEIFLKDSQGNVLKDQSGNPLKIQVFVEEGAKIKTNAPGGRVIIAAPTIINAGSIETPDGQAILAASRDKVYLQEVTADSGSDIRGLLVELGTGGAVNNTGKILAERGNVSLIGFAVNQEGIASATTSVRLNGSVRLLAREGIQDPSATNGKLLPGSTTRSADLGDGLGTSATVTLAGGSLTSVDLDADKTATALDAQAQNRSHIEISGHKVMLRNNSLVQAKSGNVGITAVDNLAAPLIKGSGRIYLEEGSKIDVSGVKDVQLAAERNIVKLELRKNELRDAPLQKDGILYGKTISVDIRDIKNGKIPIADLSGALARIERNIDERSTSGGTIDLTSSGDVLTKTGSVLDFSGGSVKYQEGIVETTKLISDGVVYDIADADPNRHYEAIVGQVIKGYGNSGVTESWSVPGLAVKKFESGYVDGRPGGTLNIDAYETLMDGQLHGETIESVFQRGSDNLNPGSTLSIDLARGNQAGKQDIVFNKSGTPSNIGFNEPLPRKSASSSEALALSIDPGLFKRSGISNINISTNGAIRIEQDAKVELNDFGSLDLSAEGIDVQGSIIAPSGDISLHSLRGGADTASHITLATGAGIDVRGQWVNDILDGQQGQPLKPLSIDGGSVTLVADQGDLRLDKGSLIDVSGGAWVQNNAQVEGGHGGAIKLVAETKVAGGTPSNLILEGDLTGWALEHGGSLDINTNEVIIGPAEAVPVHAGSNYKPLVLGADFFQQGGFADYAISSNLYGLKVAENVRLHPLQRNLQLNTTALSQASGNDLQAFSNIITLPDFLRNPTNLKLSYAGLIEQNRQEFLSIGKGAEIVTDMLGHVELHSDTSIYVDGTISTPAGKISINIDTPSGSDTGFYKAQGIWLGSSSRLLAQGVFKQQISPIGLHIGDVLSGGNVELTANRGYIIARANSRINVSGSSEVLDLQQTSPLQTGVQVVQRNIGSTGGNIIFKAGEGVLANGSFNAKGGEGAAGGSLTVTLDKGLRIKPDIPVSGGLFPDDVNPLQDRSIIVSADTNPVLAGGPANTVDIPTVNFGGRAFLKSATINKAGFDSLHLKTDVFGGVKGDKYVGQIRFDGDVQLNADRQIVLDAPILQTTGGHVELNTAYAALGSTLSRRDVQVSSGVYSSTLAPDATTGTGTFKVNAQSIDLVGGLSFKGFGQVDLDSAGDVRAIGIRVTPDTKNYLGSLKVAGDLTVKASQVYASTLTDYKINVSGNDSRTVTIQSSGATPSAAYSAGSSLTINAPHIVQQGTLKAPFGSINLNASKTLELAAGSLTSVSGDGLTIPFGQGSGGLNWLYPLDSAGTRNIVIDTPPEKRVTLNSPDVALKTGAKVDLSGGGDLYAYEFITGPGGSNDVLDPNATGYSQNFAVLPGFNNSLTPYDPLEFPSSGLTVGDSIYLSDGSGLSAGWYTLLPAHYALLQGAYLITPQAGTQDLTPGATLTNLAGATVVAGRYGVAGTSIQDTRWQGFAVEAGSIARTRSEFRDYSANQFFADKALKDATVAPQLPRDAGSLSITAKNSLALGADLAAAPAANGLGGLVDISADHLSIVGRREDVASSAPGTVSLLAEDLNQLKAPSLLLGGVRSKTKAGQRVTVTSQTLDVAGDVDLHGEEILLAAKNQLKLTSGSLVESIGKTDVAGINLLVSNQQGTNAAANSDGALLRVSSSGQAEVIRDNTVTGQTGTLIVEAGATLRSGNSMLLDSTQNTIFDGSIDMQGGSLALKSSRISLGNAPSDTPGLVLSSTQFNLDELKLTSTTDFDIYGSVSINTKQLAIAAANINGFNNSGVTASISATDTIKLSNDGATAARTGDGTGTLALSAREIQLGNGKYAINGFKQVDFNATEAIKGLGQINDPVTGNSSLTDPGTLTVAGDLNLNAGHFIGDNGATTTIDASGHQVNIASPTVADSAWTSGLGVRWSITGDSINSTGRFDLPSGILELKALTGDVALNNGSVIDVSGRNVSFGSLVKYSPAGSVLLQANKGNVELDSGAVINLAGASVVTDKNTGATRQASDAGLLDVKAAKGRFVWNGTIDSRGATETAAELRQGRLHLDVNSFGTDGFSLLNSKSANAGFSEELFLEQRSGNITIASADTVHAHQFRLTADQGAVNIDGSIDASGIKAGSVSIYGRNGIVLGASSHIAAKATKAGAAGGSVIFDTVHRDDTGTGLLDLSAAGSSIDVAGGSGGLGGSVHLRTGRNDADKTVAITAINTTINGSDPYRTAVEATRVYANQTTITAADIAKWQTDTAEFMSTVAALTNNSGAAIQLLPGIEVRSTGDLTLQDQWDFMDGIKDLGHSSWRYNNAQGQQVLPGFLTLRAGGDLNIKASITDAFATAALPGQDASILVQDLLQPGQSWSYNLVAGGNVKLANTYQAPDPLGFGGLVDTQVKVRTGTGSIDITAGSDIRFLADSNNPQAAAAVYTMGRPADYVFTDLQQGNIPGLPVRQANEDLATYLQRLDPAQVNTLLRFGYLDVSLLGESQFFAEYPTQGGAINLRAGGNIDGIETGQLMTDWLVKAGSWNTGDETIPNRPTAWGVNVSGNFSFDDILTDASGNVVIGKGNRFFNQNVGALGGGDVTVDAGGDVRNLSVMIPTTGKPLGSKNEQAEWLTNGTVVNGGGDLQVTAGSDIVGGEYYTGLGSGRLTAGDSIAKSASGIGAILELGDASFSAQARTDLNLGTVFNPTMIGQKALPDPQVFNDSFFFTYSADSMVNLSSTAGNLILDNNVSAIKDLKGVDNGTSSGFEFSVYPGTLQAAALSGDVRFNGSFTLFPSAKGSLQLLANRNVTTDVVSDSQPLNVNVSDADPLLLPSLLSPAQLIEGDADAKIYRARERLNPALSDASIIHATTPIHKNSTVKSIVTANLGDISFPAITPVAFYLPHASEFSAGRDINNLSLSGQNLSPADVTYVKAGRDIKFDSLLDSNGVVLPISKSIQLGGPGQLDVLAGRNINLGSSSGIQTVGNLVNTALDKSGGAVINILAGLSDKVDFASFITKYKNTEAYKALLQSLDGKTEQEQREHLDVLLQVLFEEIKQSALAAASAPETERFALYKRGFDAIKALFPGDKYAGDLSLVFSQVKTLAGGDINMATPGGKIDVGLAGKVGGISKEPDELGIVVQQQGNLNAFTKGDFNVNQSRVFTLGGGDIVVWSSEGSIDAGKGAKAAISAPPPITSIDDKGNIVTIFPPVVSGSGIQAINPEDKTKRQGNVYLAAPVGVVDAGEAGIGGGKIVIAATAVIGASFIQSSGGTIGVPTAVAPPVTPAGADSAATSASKASNASNDGNNSDSKCPNGKDEEGNCRDGKSAVGSIINADVVGYGSCSVADVREGKPDCGG